MLYLCDTLIKITVMIKTNFTYLILVSFLLISCNDEIMPDYSFEEANNSLHAVFDSESDKEAILSLGFDINGVVNNEDHYVVEGDIRLEKKNLTTESQIQLRQARWSELISYSNQNNITVGVSSLMPASGVDNWRTEIQKAINNWNNISGCRIRMTYTTSTNPDILIIIDNELGTGTLAKASWPENGKAGSCIRINLDYAKQMSINSSEKEYHMTHELGHCLGLRHTNWASRNETTAIRIPGTPYTDDNSVMIGGRIKRGWEGFTKYDIVAIRVLYPEIPTTIQRTSIGGGSTTNLFAYKIVNPVPDVVYRWSVTGRAHIYNQSQADGTVTVKLTERPATVVLYIDDYIVYSLAL